MNPRQLRMKEQLGMLFPTAQQRLVKLLLFQLAEQCRRNFCYRCGKSIDRVEQFGIDHKLPWEGVSSDLFWDLTNVAFYHRKCNYQHCRGNKNVHAPTGTVWCSRHELYLPSTDFYPNAGHSTGFSNYCKECAAKNRREAREQRQNVGIAAAYGGEQ